MSDKNIFLSNNNGFFSNPKARMIIVAVAVVMIGVAIFSIWKYRSKVAMAHMGTADVTSAPSMQSIPGAGAPSNEYVETQNLQNEKQAREARKNATSSVPTITRPNFKGNPNEFGELPKVEEPKKSLFNTEPKPLLCPLNKVVVMYKPNPSACTLENLRLARQAGVEAEELICRGCACPLLKAAGYTAGDLKAIGLTAEQLRDCGFSEKQLLAAGISKTVKETKEKAPLSASSGYCSPENIKKMREQGVSALEIKNKGCDIEALKAAGFTPAELKAAGFSAKQLKDAGFSAQELKAAGYSAKDLHDAGFSAAELKKAGFSAKELKDAGFSAGQLKDAGFDAAELKAAGFSAKDLKDAGFSAKDLKDAGYSPSELQAAGYTKGDLLRAGFTPEQAGYAKEVVAAPAEVKVVQAPEGQAQRQPVNQYQAQNQAPVANVPSMPQAVDNSPEAQLARLAKAAQQQMNVQQQADMVQQMQGAMTVQAQKLLAGWSNSAPQGLAQAPAPVETNNQGGGANGGGNANAARPILKAGSIMFAVLDTSINSDEPSPIMARVVTGPLKGARLLGQFTRVDKRVLVSFNLLNDPRLDKSIPVNAVAIDPDTARTAVGGQVNNHYLLRYGTLFASAFLQGLATATLQSGATVIPTPLGERVVYPKLSPAQYLMVGAGTVGQRYSQVMANNFDRPPTIKIQGGTGVGVLLMSDLMANNN